MQALPSDSDLYDKFSKTIVKGDTGWVLAIFEGSPEGGAYSWCPDCVVAKPGLVEFLAEYRGPVKVVQYKVGTKDEWEGREGGPSPFKQGFPHLVDLPSAVLFRGRLDVARVIAVRKQDLEYLTARAEEYERQIRSGAWSPPNQKE